MDGRDVCPADLPMTRAASFFLPTTLAGPSDLRMRGIVDDHYAFLHRSLRRLGVPASRVEDAAQQVLLVIARRLPDVAPAAERAFLFSTALRTAADVRKSLGRRREVHDEAHLAAERDPAPGADERLEDACARRLLDEVLDRLPMDLRAVLVLSDLEELTMAKIAELLAVPPGTVASRLRRARELFVAEARAARLRLEGGGP